MRFNRELRDCLLHCSARRAKVCLREKRVRLVSFVEEIEENIFLRTKGFPDAGHVTASFAFAVAKTMELRTGDKSI